MGRPHSISAVRRSRIVRFLDRLSEVLPRRTSLVSVLPDSQLADLGLTRADTETGRYGLITRILYKDADK